MKTTISYAHKLSIIKCHLVHILLRYVNVLVSKNRPELGQINSWLLIRGAEMATLASMWSIGISEGARTIFISFKLVPYITRRVPAAYSRQIHLRVSRTEKGENAPIRSEAAVQSFPTAAAVVERIS